MSSTVALKSWALGPTQSPKKEKAAENLRGFWKNNQTLSTSEGLDLFHNRNPQVLLACYRSPLT